MFAIIFLQKRFLYSFKIEIQPHFTLHEKKPIFFQDRNSSISDYKKITFSENQFFFILTLKQKSVKYLYIYLKQFNIYSEKGLACICQPKTPVSFYL